MRSRTRPPPSARAAIVVRGPHMPVIERKLIMSDYAERAGLQVAPELVTLIEADLKSQLRLDTARFWTGLAALLDELVPVNQALLARRDWFQRGIDEWHRVRRGQPFDVAAHEAQLRSTGYLVEEGPDFCIGTQNVDA